MANKSKYYFDQVEKKLDIIRDDQGSGKMLLGDGTYGDIPKTDGLATEQFVNNALDEVRELVGGGEQSVVFGNISERDFNIMEAVTELTIPEGVINVKPTGYMEIDDEGEQSTYIENYFSDFINLKKLTLPSTVTELVDYNFLGMNTLEELVLSDNLMIIGEEAISSCDALVQLVIPASVKEIKSYAISYNDNLTRVVFKGKPSSIQSYAFGGCDSLKNIYVPWSRGAVSGAPWGAAGGAATVHYDYTGD